MSDIRERHDKNSNSSPEHSREENTEMETWLNKITQHNVVYP